MARRPEFEIVEHGDPPSVILAVRGELDMGTIGELSERVGARLTDGVSELRLDLRELSFMDSSGLRLLIELSDRARSEGWRLRLTPPRAEAAALVLRATGADRALPFEDGPAT
ncbi:MAG TPA: STAS domain-containing protein [Solirubrobacteraceae bacterium]|nr:STAS domain-containing protein [Solirubrobacteraceae bacterium]